MQLRGFAMRHADTHSALIGRDREVQALAERIDAAGGARGGALLVRGEAGIGKTSLLEAARTHAAAKRFQVLTTTGVQSESRLPFAGLHQLIRPTLHQADRLPESYAKAIRSAFGLDDEASPSPYLIAMAVLHLLGECTEATPVLLLADDAHWLDYSTAEALAFVARRLESDPMVLIAAMRDGYESPFLKARIPELRVEALSEEDAASLVDARSPQLHPSLRERVLSEAAGNPLALVELSISLRAMTEGDPARRAGLPLTNRLELAFADRLSSLSPDARTLLQFAAIDESGALDELLVAASKFRGQEITSDAAAEAGAAGLVIVDNDLLHFRHPLMRSAIQQAMSPEQRRATHGVLAATIAGDSERCVWHQAAAVVGKSEPVASELEMVAQRAKRRGAASTVFAALERAAQLTDDPRRRGSLLIRAAFNALVLGRTSEAHRLIDTIDDQQLGPIDRPQAAYLREFLAEKSGSDFPLLASLVEIADRMRAEGNVSGGLRVLVNLAAQCWWSNLDESRRAHVIAVAERFPVPESEQRLIYVLALAGPVERGAMVLERVSRHWAELPSAAGSDVYMLGMASMGVGDFVHAERFLDVSINHCRTQGMLGLLASILTFQAWTKVQLGDWKKAESLAGEGARMADEAAQKSWITVAELASATIAAYRGDTPAAEAFASAANKALAPHGATSMLALLEYSRGSAALADSRNEEAYQHLKRIFDAADSAYHAHVRSWALVDLVEAAVLSGHEAEASAIVSELEPTATRTRSPLLKVALEFARPVLAPDDNEAAFQASLGARLANWPFIRARLQLAYGLWLRRRRRAADSRIPLRAARDAFDALGAVPWSERARNELRASGETSRGRDYDLIDALSPQEFQIAQMAASGLSNKEIGQQLFLSNRTIGNHLYRVFPKLGITARSQLRDALQDRSLHPPS